MTDGIELGKLMVLDVPVSQSKKTWGIIFSLLPLVLIGPLAMDMYLPALPAFRHSLGISAHMTQWTLSIFVFGFGLSQLFVGFLADKFGSMRCLFYGLLMYILSSVALSCSNQIEMIMVLRFTQALGSCFIIVISMGLVTKLLPNPKDNLLAYSMLSGATGLAPILAPILGALLLAQFQSWHVIFVFLSFFALVGMTVYQLVIKKFAISHNSANSLSTANYFLIIRQGNFWRFALVGACGMSILFTFFSLAPYVFMEQYQLSHQQFSLAFGCGAFFFMIGNFLGPKAVDTWGIVRTIKASYGFLLGLSLPFAVASQHYHSLFIFLVWVSLINSLIGLSFGPAMSNAMKSFSHCADEAASIYGFQQFLIAFLIGTSFIYFVQKTIIAYGVFITICTGLIYLFIKKQEDTSHV